MKQEKVNIESSICRVFEYIGVFGCSTCGDFNHIVANCTNYSTENCKCSTLKCAKCADLKGIIDLDLDILNASENRIA